jgi:cold shock CspA family protein
VAKRTTGAAPWFDGSKGYCGEDGEEVFVYYIALSAPGRSLLLGGERVGLFLERTLRGPRTTDVTRLN